ncbi:MAG: bacillithiol biosynthesis cysteine-adding enzyme BshC [Acidobacteriota bacterium]|nr:bacillithiol biosynthesis cysteine-adding enzyme BshC [Acidobacteriota bacterium]
MEASCIRQTELPHTTRLFADLIYHRDRVSRFYPEPSYKHAASQIHFSPEKRAALVSALRERNNASESLDMLARPGTVAVVTGQQVGLFSGPAYTIYKALTAVKLARELTATGIPAVPIFWIATEDHDFAEVNQAWMFDREHHPHELRAGATPGPNQPVGEVTLEHVPIDKLNQILDGLPFAEDILARVRDTYVPGRSFGHAFGALVANLLSGYGILQIDPMSAAVRELAAPAMRDAVAAAPDLTRELLRRNRELTEAGYHAQVHVEEQTALFFLLENGRRLSLRRQNGEYVSQGRRFSTEELMDRAHQLSPNALLRPVIQDFMLPTVAYVGGPAELAYLAQSQVIYERLLGRQPVGLHRSGFTVLDARSRKLMARYRLELPDFFQGEEALRMKIAGSLVPSALAQTMQTTKDITEREIERLASELAQFDPTLAKALAKSRRKIDYQLSKIGHKVAFQTLQRDTKAAQDASSLYGLVFPNKHLQERLYSIVPLIAKHGMELIGSIYDNIHLDCPDHQMFVA